jgi:hypothetical protein
LLDRPPEFARDDGFYLGGADWRRRILQLCQLSLVFRREQVGPGGEDLPELDEAGTELLERLANVLGTRRRLVVSTTENTAKRHESRQAEPADKKAESMTGKDLADLTVTPDL